MWRLYPALQPRSQIRLIIVVRMNFAIRSHRVLTPSQITAATVLVEQGKIAGILSYSESPAGAHLIDIGDRMLLPGLTDPHVHVNEPGRTEWEGFSTATRAAAAGGYTTIIDMPLNCLPETTNVSALELKRAAAKNNCFVDYGFWGGVVADNRQDIESLAAAGVLGYKCFLIYPGIEGFTMVTGQQLEGAMPHVARTGLPLLAHAELDGPICAACDKLAKADWKDYKTWVASHPEEAEIEAIDLLIRLSREYNARVHIVHLSSAKALARLHAARAEGVPITVETCPHYLHFNDEAIGRGNTLFKCAPPIRSKSNQHQLWQALKDGDIDMIASDHSPCPPHMKGLEAGDFQTAWGGIASLSIAFPVLWTEAKKRNIAMTQLLAWTAEKTARLAGLDKQKGKIEAGFDADLVVFDPDAEWTVTPERLHFRHPISPYVGETLVGTVETTFVRGHKVWDKGKFSETPMGQECVAA
jgi:allantoinase